MRAEILLISSEFGMKVITFVLCRALFAEAVHVELPDEGGKVGMLEISGQDGVGEPLWVEDEETDSIEVPVEDVAERLILSSRTRTLSMS